MAEVVEEIDAKVEEEEKKQEEKEKELNVWNNDYAGTPYIPIYVMLPLNTISLENEVVDPEGLIEDLEALKSAGVDGVMVDCWWGIVEGKHPRHYQWSGYHHLFSIVRNAKLKLQVVMSFHQCGGNVGDDVNISLPEWVLKIANHNADIFFTNSSGAHNPECLSWGIDKVPVLQERTALQVYYEYMLSFRQQMEGFFADGTITEIEVGLGPCGELRYPSYAQTQGWTFPGIGEFQCYDKYMMEKLRKAAEVQRHPEWGMGPSNAGSYNSRPQETEFFKDGGDYCSPYGKFFLSWYSQTLIEHGDSVLKMANLALKDVKISAKVPGIHWWYRTESHAAEATAGFFTADSRCGYKSIARMFATHNTTFNFTCAEMRTADQPKEALCDPEALVVQALNAAWDSGISAACENALSCYGQEDYNQILKNAKPMRGGGATGHHLDAFTYLRLSPDLMEEHNFEVFAHFVCCLHGELEDSELSSPHLHVEGD
ncbi:hypothetical protein BDL97_10G006000 [Sphagnum fallax]|nr:hypothetical protein BDL97_10G006000 [Sphagnum fallax]